MSTTLRMTGLASAVLALGCLGGLALGEERAGGDDERAGGRERAEGDERAGEDERTQPTAAEREEGLALADRLSAVFTYAAAEATPSVVFLEVEREVELPGFGLGEAAPFGGPEEPEGPPLKFRLRGHGSGFVVSEDGTILTNHHVVGDADTILAHLHDGRVVPAHVVGTDVHSEVAVIRLDDPGEGLRPLVLGESAPLSPGHWAIAVGNPFGLTETVTVGVISAIGRSRVGIADFEDFIQTDAAINPGNSGGPLLDIRGRAIGINTAIVSSSGGYQGVGFAIPIDMVKVIVEQLLEHGRVIRGHLGVTIQEVDMNLAEALALETTHGALVAHVEPGSPAERGGIQVGDVIVGLEGDAITGTGELRNAIALTSPGTDVTLTVVRNGERLDLPVTVGELGEASPTGQELGLGPEPAAGPAEELGLTVRELDQETAREVGLEGGSGLLVTDVDEEGPAARAGVRPGAVIVRVGQEPTDNVDALRRAIANARGAGRALVLLRDGDGARFTVVPLRE